jgi:HD-GYP domain-containing protein (c-di-GMP phosphodiesterase class II)
LQELYKCVFKRYDEHPETIPLPSRIIAGVRGFDDIVSLRSAGGGDITEQFIKTRGKQFCPEVVDAIVDVACRHYALR